MSRDDRQSLVDMLAAALIPDDHGMRRTDLFRSMDPPRDLERLCLACRCGQALQINVPARAERAVRRSWQRVHQGNGHGPASPEALIDARLEEEHALLGELRGTEAFAAAALLGAVWSSSPRGKSRSRPFVPGRLEP